MYIVFYYQTIRLVLSIESSTEENVMAGRLSAGNTCELELGLGLGLVEVGYTGRTSKLMRGPPKKFHCTLNNEKITKKLRFAQNPGCASILKVWGSILSENAAKITDFRSNCLPSLQNSRAVWILHKCWFLCYFLIIQGRMALFRGSPH